MVADNLNQSSLPFSGKIYTVCLGAFIIVLSTTVPYLTLLRDVLFLGIFLAGAIVLNHSILRYQVRLTYSDAFFLGSVAGMAGGIVSEGVTFILMELFHYRPGAESLSLLIGWVVEIAKGKPELHDQVQRLIAEEKLVLAVVKLNFKELLMNMFLTGAVYAPIAGFGGAYAVLRLKRKAKKS
ncbi:MAG: hypothetical protein WCK32_02800 [Chlorobiaceae bacterium]